MKTALLGTALLCLSSLPSLGQRPLLGLRSEGIDALVVDARDAGLRRMLDVAGARLGEIFTSLGAPPAAASALGLLTDVLARPMALDLVLDEGAPLPVRGSLSVRARDAEDAAYLLWRIDRLLEDAGVPRSPAADGMRTVQVGPNAEVAFGISGETLRVRLGAGGTGDLALDARDLEPGASRAAILRVDMSAIASLFASFAPEGPEAEQIQRAFQMMGIGAAGSGQMTFSLGFDGELMHSAARVEQGVEAARRMGSWTGEPLGEANLAMIPADATFAMLTQLDLVPLIELYLGEEGLLFLDQLEQQLGMSPVNDVLQHLGTTYGGYASFSSGGGGVQSLVGFARVADEAALAEGLALAEKQLEAISAAEMEGRVALRKELLAGEEATVLAFPGLPVPIELTYGLAHGWLIGAASPQAFEAAVLQSAGELADLRDNPRFQASLPERGRGAWQSLQFVDTPELLREGYGWMTWVSAALSNALRGPAGEADVPPRLLPSYLELARGARASVTVSFVDGADIVSIGRSDRSWTASFAGALGLPWTGIFAASMAGGAAASFMAPRMIESMAPSQHGLVYIELAQISEALDQYALMNGGRYPESLEVLVAPDENGQVYLEGGWVPTDPWGSEYQYIPPAPGDRGFQLFSLGADGLPGGSGEDADIHWER